MASRPSKEVLGVSAMRVSVLAVEGVSRTAEVPCASSSAWSLPSNSYSAPALSSLSSSHNSGLN